jgi:toxin ParE1/3/4
MIRRVIFTQAAEREFEAIGDHIALSNPLRAVSFVQELRERRFSLVDMPTRFPLMHRYSSTGIRRCLHGKYLIFYRMGGTDIEIIHVLHGAMEYEKILFGED